MFEANDDNYLYRWRCLWSGECGSHGCHWTVIYIQTHATTLSILCWWLGLDVSHDSMAVMNLVILTVMVSCCLRPMMTQGYVIEMALLMLISVFVQISWFSWLSSKHVRRPYPSNCSLTDARMAWVGRLSCFHGCHNLGFLLSTFVFSRQTNMPSSILFYLIL